MAKNQHFISHWKKSFHMTDPVKKHVALVPNFMQIFKTKVTSIVILAISISSIERLAKRLKQFLWLLQTNDFANYQALTCLAVSTSVPVSTSASIRVDSVSTCSSIHTGSAGAFVNIYNKYIVFTDVENNGLRKTWFLLRSDMDWMNSCNSYTTTGKCDEPLMEIT